MKHTQGLCGQHGVLEVRLFAKVIEPEQQTNHLVNYLVNRGLGNTFVCESDRARTANSPLGESLSESGSWKYVRLRK